MPNEPVWTVDGFYQKAVSLAARADQPVEIAHFWLIADKELNGEAPKDVASLAERALNYAVFDEVMTKYGTPGDPDIDASILRKKIYDENKSSLKSNEDIVRFFCLTNLLFLGREVFNKLFTFSTHARICNFFVQKNPSLSLDQQEPGELKERLLLFPRGGFKSTVDIIDCVQWIINWPDVRILILAASTDLATAFIGELKNYFVLIDKSEPTAFQRLFSNHKGKNFLITQRSDGKEDSFICPARTKGDDKKKEPTAWSASILTNLPGWHCDVMKSDDTVNDKNSATPGLIKKVIDKIDFAESLIDPGGYKDLIGTPYAGTDLYSHAVALAEKPEDLKMLKFPAMWLKPESQHKEEKDTVESDYILLFEHDKTGRKRLTYDFLRKKRRKNPAIYNSQYLLNPEGVKKVKFPLDLLIQRTITPDQLPTRLIHYILWDFAYAANSDNDYSVGAVIGLDEENRVFVLEIFRDHYKDSDLAMEVAKSYKQYQPKMVLIENSNGAQFLESSIRRYAEEMGVSYIPLDFFKCDRTVNAKASRIGALQPLLVQGRLFFLNSIACLHDNGEGDKGLYGEFKDFGSASHDDIPDAISHVHRVLPMQSVEPRGPGGREEVERMMKRFAEDEFFNMIHGDAPPPSKLVPIPVEAEVPSELVDPYAIPGWK